MKQPAIRYVTTTVASLILSGCGSNEESVSVVAQEKSVPIIVQTGPIVVYEMTDIPVPGLAPKAPGDVIYVDENGTEGVLLCKNGDDPYAFGVTDGRGGSLDYRNYERCKFRSAKADNSVTAFPPEP